MQDILNFLATHLTLNNLLIILFLIVIEGILSFDNAIGLAAIVKSKLTDKKEQKQALMFGVISAYTMRSLMLIFGVYIIQYKWVQLFGAGYLLYLGISELIPNRFKAEKESKEKVWFTFLPNFWRVIATVELMDVAFSLDSVLVALAVTDVMWLLITGVFIGIIMMRISAIFIIKLIDKYPIIEKTAFILILLASISMFLRIFEIHVPETPFIVALLSVLIVSVSINHMYPVAVDTFIKKYYKHHK